MRDAFIRACENTLSVLRVFEAVAALGKNKGDVLGSLLNVATATAQCVQHFKNKPTLPPAQHIHYN